MRYRKYHGLGNDFLLVEKEDVNMNKIEDSVRAICHRRFGVGADGVVLVDNEDPTRFTIYNADGSRAPMCGNAIRCFSHDLERRRLFKGCTIDITTDIGVLSVERIDRFGNKVKVAMGKPRFDCEDIPVNSNDNKYIDKKIYIDGTELNISAVFMGTTHAVIYVDRLDKIDVAKIGPIIENHPLFPKGTNVNFCEVISRNRIVMKTWERGVGLTLACGTGACASVVVGKELELLENDVSVAVEGGMLWIDLKEEVYMTGGSKLVSEGTFYL